ncbi:adenosylmethionine--8-amino-7-oxononanoate transaminase [Shewanella litorisediminis]|uniref:Adenosylmethionine-8-amino-7-oxononanoate aminotransferase n=1 Tax=Shewanella litorisediminis TaxID=1173586 RepID=A0ABX7G748_9GAMM|nr:adenosylmethionine--8-amino-7-oxononanoate transaminase [Shewanella litorisediminis]MCL2916670.1 adenosylmethionine--8-amino-7-oxononanoate transaminase [Shewanella litorisediminis]QRH03156.1 adenosylmethionine--8-amino-7-oxononanoate transaminase [Shewanella litorisediminis]
MSIDFEFDRNHLWHPYTSMASPLPVLGVKSAAGCRLTLEDGSELVDGTSSWWSAIHGYGHPALIDAVKTQAARLSHVMFGGLTHEPATDLGKALLKLVHPGLTKVFYADSGSVAVEVALKMAIQYWQGRSEPQKHKLLTVLGGYHGDTFAAISVCDPNSGMHGMFGHLVPKQIFAKAPPSGFGHAVEESDLAELRALLSAHHHEIAALIIEPIMQGAGGLRFHSPDYLKAIRTLCDEYKVLLILDEIATGFGRTGKAFAYEHAGIAPDLLCLGKALTGGMLSLAATLCTDEVAAGISNSPAGVFMHGPTFMANPLACAAASASLALFAENHWQSQVANIEARLTEALEVARSLPQVADVRVLGAVGVIEMVQTVDTAFALKAFAERGVWVRPFGKLIYVMPPYCISDEELGMLTHAMVEVAALEGICKTAHNPAHG